MLDSPAVDVLSPFVYRSRSWAAIEAACHRRAKNSECAGAASFSPSVCENVLPHESEAEAAAMRLPASAAACYTRRSGRERSLWWWAHRRIERRWLTCSGCGRGLAFLVTLLHNPTLRSPSRSPLSSRRERTTEHSHPPFSRRSTHRAEPGPPGPRARGSRSGRVRAQSLPLTLAATPDALAKRDVAHHGSVFPLSRRLTVQTNEMEADLSSCLFLSLSLLPLSRVSLIHPPPSRLFRPTHTTRNSGLRGHLGADVLEVLPCPMLSLEDGGPARSSRLLD
ncbi:hypothetical protein B0H13DRAFT_2668479 [Mycena leptocephala]|nr:hypothetical protein B0H13DRAFT_2668479 [Mycena leptocephala]